MLHKQELPLLAPSRSTPAGSRAYLIALSGGLHVLAQQFQPTAASARPSTCVRLHARLQRRRAVLLWPGQVACAKRMHSNTPAELLLTGLTACRMAQEAAAATRVPSLASVGEGACSMAAHNWQLEACMPGLA